MNNIWYVVTTNHMFVLPFIYKMFKMDMKYFSIKTDENNKLTN